MSWRRSGFAKDKLYSALEPCRSAIIHGGDTQVDGSGTISVTDRDGKPWALEGLLQASYVRLLCLATKGLRGESKAADVDHQIMLQSLQGLGSLHGEQVAARDFTWEKLCLVIERESAEDSRPFTTTIDLTPYVQWLSAHPPPAATGQRFTSLVVEVRLGDRRLSYRFPPEEERSGVVHIREDDPELARNRVD